MFRLFAGAGRAAVAVFQNLAHLFGERGRRERLLKERDFLMENAVIDHRAVGVAGYLGLSVAKNPSCNRISSLCGSLPRR